MQGADSFVSEMFTELKEEQIAQSESPKFTGALDNE